MSFSATPLGQGRRLDQHTFLNKPHPTNRPPSPRSIPTSYAIGAPTLGTRSSTKPSTRDGDNLSTDHDPAIPRFARPRHQPDIANRPGGPKIISSPPKPEKWSVKDTSVNIATAFHQAVSTTALDMPPTNPNDSWASSSRSTTNVHRSTSVEYEQQSQSTATRRLAPPPNRLAPPARTYGTARKPLSKTVSVRHVPDSEGEEDPELSKNENGRGKSPFGQVVDITKRALAPATFYLRQRSQDPETPSATANGKDKDPSYDYSAEEREYQAQAKRTPVSRRVAAANKRNRMSSDNMPYRPSMSDLEDDDDDVDDDGKKGKRRKKKKKDLPGGPLTTLPVAGYDKKKKRKSRGSKGNTADPDEDDRSASEEQASEHQSVYRESVPPASRFSVPRGSVPPSQPPNPEEDVSMDIEQGLESIAEVNETTLEPKVPEAPSSAPVNSRNSFSIGGFLGKCVYQLYRFLAFVFWMLWFGLGKLFGGLYVFVLKRPGRWVALQIPGFFRITAYTLLVGVIYFAWPAIHEPISQWIPLLSSGSTGFRPPSLPPADIAELSARLQKIESALSGLASEHDRSRARIETEVKRGSDFIGRLGTLESQVQRENARAAQAEAQIQQMANQGVLGVKQEVEALQALISSQGSREVAENDEEARVRMKALEERIGGIEGGVKEALELGRKAGAASSAGATWWHKPTTGGASNSALTIKTTDGQDVTSLIGHLVGSAIGKDVVGQADFALHSAGGRIIPSLTSPTYEMSPPSIGGKIAGLITGNGFGIGRPPITALHHELHSGHCWPFEGPEGQLGVALAAPLYITDITIDHVAKEVALDMRSAPREMEVWGMVEGKDNVAKVREWQAEKTRKREAARAKAKAEGVPFEEDEESMEPVYPRTLPKKPQWIRIASFSYNIRAPSHIQTFPVSQEVRNLGVDFGIVALRVKNNWGRAEFTCLYRLRVHGQQMGEIPIPYPEVA